MAHDDMDDEDEVEERDARRASGPRFGPFVTIAVAILMMFGAISRMGKTSDSGGWLNFDFLASKSLEQDRLRQQERRNTTLITLGAIPSPIETAVPPMGMQLREDVVPPERNVDFYAYQENQRRQHASPAPLSLAVPLEGNYHPGSSESTPRFDPAPEARSLPVPEARVTTYTVAQGDSWVKIGKNVGKPWQDIQKANPQAQNGLRVGMKLTIP